MSDPLRLLDGSGDGGGATEKALLHSWTERQPSESARMKTLAAWGSGAGP